MHSNQTIDRKTLRVATVSAMLGVPKPTIYRWVKEGLLSASRVGTVVMIPVDSVERLLREHPAQAQSQVKDR